MPDNGWNETLAAAAGEVLETMFFTQVYGPAEASEASVNPHVALRLAFAGTPSGALTLSVSEPAARSLASGFLGAADDEPPPDSELGNVVSELANMICGTLLSRMRTEEDFRLSTPELLAGGALPKTPPDQSLDLGDGAIHLWLALDNHAC